MPKKCKWKIKKYIFSRLQNFHEMSQTILIITEIPYCKVSVTNLLPFFLGAFPFPATRLSSLGVRGASKKLTCLVTFLWAMDFSNLGYFWSELNDFSGIWMICRISPFIIIIAFDGPDSIQWPQNRSVIVSAFLHEQLGHNFGLDGWNCKKVKKTNFLNCLIDCDENDSHQRRSHMF